MKTSSSQERSLTAEQVVTFVAMLDEQRQFRVEQIAEHSLRAALCPVETPAEHEVNGLVMRGAICALADIEAALGRIANGTYGHCVLCLQEISVERLEVLPHAATCLRCEGAR